MLGKWRSHNEYQVSLIDNVNRELEYNPESVKYYETAILKMYQLNLDNVYDDFAPLYSTTGRPSNQQPEIFRSFLLMSEYKCSELENWIARAKSSKLLCALIGVTPKTFPGESTHRDFISRLWQADDSNHNRTFERKPRKKHGKDKIPPKHPGIIKTLVDKALSGEVFNMIPERILQSLFIKLAIVASVAMGLLGDTSKLIVSGDGTCITSNASSRGVKTCNCEGSCSCPRRFSDPDARWGWDSYHETWFFGYTAYLLSVHNSDLKLDLPIYMKFVEAARNDGVTLITAIAHARYLYGDSLTIDSLLADAAHDHYPIYDLLNQLDIKAFIDLNKRNSSTDKLKKISVSANGIPVCADGHEMLNWGIDKKRHRTKYRCPMVTGKVKFCFYAENCNKTDYGKVVYVKHDSDLRLFPVVPRGSDEWREIYKQRTAAERVNNRILTDYQLERPKRYGKKKIAFFAFLNAINVHLDAHIKFGNTSLNSILG